MKRIIPIVTLILIVLLAAVGCNGGRMPEDTSGTFDDTAAETTVEATAEETAGVSTDADTTAAGETAQPSDDSTADETAPGETSADTTPSAETAAETAAETTAETTAEETTEAPIEAAEYPIPIIRITTDDGNNLTNSGDKSYHPCKITVENCDDKYLLSAVQGNIKLRGNSTIGPEKKPYRIKFETKQMMLGLNGDHKFKSWVLMADYYDPSLMRTLTAFNLADTCVGKAAFTSDFTHVEIYLNGDYKGVYLLCEQTQINKNRVEIFEKEDGYTGTDIGYLLVGQGGRADEDYTVSNFGVSNSVTDVYGNTMNISLPNFSLASGDYTSAQVEYIRKWIAAAFDASYQAIYNNKYYTIDRDTCELVKITKFEWAKTEAEKQQEAIATYMDIDSAVRMYMFDEIVKDLDSSTFNMYVDLSPEGEGTLHFGAPWDFDFALGNTKWASLYTPTGFYANSFLRSDGIRQNFWYVMLYHAEWFRDMVKERWVKKYDELLEDCEDIITLARRNINAYNRNFERYRILGQITMSWHQNEDDASFRTHMDAATYLYNWLSVRLKWLNVQWGDGEIEVKTSEYTINMNEVSLDKLSGHKSCSTSLIGSFVKFKMEQPLHDPQAYLEVNQIANLSADTYNKKLVVTYKIPASASEDSYNTELFLVCGDMNGAEGGKSVSFEAIADGKEHTVELSLEGLSFWHGEIKRIRVDFFGSSESENDYFLLKSIKFVGEEYVY